MQKNTDTDRPATPPVDIDHVIAQLASHQAYLAAHIDRHWDDLDPLQLARTLSLYGQNAARLGRLLRYRSDIYGPPVDPVEALMDEALDRFWAEVDAEAEAEIDQHRADSPPEPPTDPFSDSITDSLADSFLDSLMR